MVSGRGSPSILRLKLNELFTLDDNIRGTRGILENLLNFGVHGIAVSIFL